MKALLASLMVASLLIGGCTPAEPTGPDQTEPYTLLIFHNNSGPMCLEALAWLDEIGPQYPSLVVEQKLTFEEADLELLQEMEAEYEQSQGVSTSFAYLPIIFFRDQAFSGFNNEVETAITGLLESME